MSNSSNEPYIGYNRMKRELDYSNNWDGNIYIPDSQLHLYKREHMKQPEQDQVKVMKLNEPQDKPRETNAVSWDMIAGKPDKILYRHQITQLKTSPFFPEFLFGDNNVFVASEIIGLIDNEEQESVWRKIIPVRETKSNVHLTRKLILNVRPAENVSPSETGILDTYSYVEWMQGINLMGKSFQMPMDFKDNPDMMKLYNGYKVGAARAIKAAYIYDFFMESRNPRWEEKREDMALNNLGNMLITWDEYLRHRSENEFGGIQKFELGIQKLLANAVADHRQRVKGAFDTAFITPLADAHIKFSYANSVYSQSGPRGGFLYKQNYEDVPKLNAKPALGMVISDIQLHIQPMLQISSKDVLQPLNHIVTIGDMVHLKVPNKGANYTASGMDILIYSHDAAGLKRIAFEDVVKHSGFGSTDFKIDDGDGGMMSTEGLDFKQMANLFYTHDKTEDLTEYFENVGKSFVASFKYESLKGLKSLLDPVKNAEDFTKIWKIILDLNHAFKGIRGNWKGAALLALVGATNAGETLTNLQKHEKENPSEILKEILVEANTIYKSINDKSYKGYTNLTNYPDMNFGMVFEAMTELTNDHWVKLARHNVQLPCDFLLARPGICLQTSDILCILSGGGCCTLKRNELEVALTKSQMGRMINFDFKVWFMHEMHSPENMRYIPHAMIEKVLGGFGHKMVDINTFFKDHKRSAGVSANHFLDRLRNGEPRDKVESIIPIVIKKGEFEGMTKPLHLGRKLKDIRDNFPKSVRFPSSEECDKVPFSTFSWYSEMFGWSNIGAFEEQYSLDRYNPNAFCYEMFHKFQSNMDGRFDFCEQQKGHLKSLINENTGPWLEAANMQSVPVYKGKW